MLKLLIDFGIVCLKTFYRLCSLLPQHNRIVCISRQSDTPPLDFQLIADYFANNDTPLQVTILSKQLANPLKYLPEVVRQVYFVATSKAVVLDSYCIAVSLLGKTIEIPVVQIWHALGNMKKAGYTALDDSSDEARSPRLAHIMHMHEGYDAIAISSFNFRNDFAAVFNANPDILFEAPLPRTDLLTSRTAQKEARKAFVEAHPQLRGKKIIVYCPTFRRTPAPNTSYAIDALIDAVDFSRYALVYKPHPVSTLSIDDSRVITARNTETDPLFAADYVISDYSTVIYEAGLIGIPVFLYAYDWKSYSQKRGMNIDLEHDVPTLFTDDPIQIMTAIENNDFDNNAYQQFIDRNVALPATETCTEQLCKKIVALIE